MSWCILKLMPSNYFSCSRLQCVASVINCFPPDMSSSLATVHSFCAFLFLLFSPIPFPFPISFLFSYCWSVPDSDLFLLLLSCRWLSTLFWHWHLTSISVLLEPSILTPCRPLCITCAQSSHLCPDCLLAFCLALTNLQCCLRTMRACWLRDPVSPDLFAERMLN